MFLRFLSLRILTRGQRCLEATEIAKIQFQTKELCSRTCAISSVGACLITYTSSNNLVCLFLIMVMQLSIKLASALVLLGKTRMLSAEESCTCVQKSCTEPCPARGAAAHLGAGMSRPVRLLDPVLVLRSQNERFPCSSVCVQLLCRHLVWCLKIHRLTLRKIRSRTYLCVDVNWFLATRVSPFCPGV